MKARAIVTVTLQISLEDRWGESCSLSQIQTQAKEEAIRILNKEFSDAAKKNITQIKPPIVTCIIADELG